VPEEEFRHIVRVAGSDLPGKKKVEYGLTKIKGIGFRVAGAICETAGVKRDKMVGHLSEKESDILTEAVENLQKKEMPGWMYNRKNDYASGNDIHVIGSELMMSLREDLNRLRKSRSYRGIRHERGLPVRGQRTRTGFRGGVAIGYDKKKARDAQQKKS